MSKKRRLKKFSKAWRSEAPSDLRELIGCFLHEICVTLWQTMVHIDGCFFYVTGVPFCWRQSHTPKRDISHRNQLMSQKDTCECYTPLEMLQIGMDAKSTGWIMVQSSPLFRGSGIHAFFFAENRLEFQPWILLLYRLLQNLSNRTLPCFMYNIIL